MAGGSLPQNLQTRRTGRTLVCTQTTLSVSPAARRDPAFEQLIADVEAGTVSAVVVWHLDRLTRSMKDLTRIIEAGKAHGVNIACVHGVSLDLGDPRALPSPKS